MTHVLFLDTEQAEIIRLAAEVSAAILDARARRVDPDRIISDSVKLQRIKVAHVLRQFDLNALPTWAMLPEQQRNAALDLMQAILRKPDSPSVEELWQTIVTIAMSNRSITEPPAAASLEQPKNL